MSPTELFFSSNYKIAVLSMSPPPTHPSLVLFRNSWGSMICLQIVDISLFNVQFSHAGEYMCGVLCVLRTKRKCENASNLANHKDGSKSFGLDRLD